MRINLCSIDYNRIEDFKRKYGEILASYSLKIEKVDDSCKYHFCPYEFDDEDNEIDYLCSIEVSTVEQLIQLTKELKADIILGTEDDIIKAQIYDGYLS